VLALAITLRRYVTFAHPDRKGGDGVVFALTAHDLIFFLITRRPRRQPEYYLNVNLFFSWLTLQKTCKNHDKQMQYTGLLGTVAE